MLGHVLLYDLHWPREALPRYSQALAATDLTPAKRALLQAQRGDAEIDSRPWSAAADDYAASSAIAPSSVIYLHAGTA